MNKAAVIASLALALTATALPAWSPAAALAPQQSAGTPEPTDVGAHPLLPDVRSVWARSIRIVSHDGVRRLRFSSTLVNIGVGPLEVVPRPGGQCPAGQRRVDQAVYQDLDRNGRFSRAIDTRRVFRKSGCMVFHASHHHWHVNASARYKLTRPGEDTPLARHSKVSFCLRDSVKWLDTRRSAFYGACSRDRRQGITPGWGDVYQWFLPGQALTLPRSLPRGLYCLHQKADPIDDFRETNEANNESVRPIRIAGTRVVYVDTQRCRT